MKIAIFFGIFISIYPVYSLSINTSEICKNKKLICENYSLEFKTFYEKKGEWANVFTMEPIKFVSSGSTCHIRYYYTPTPNSYRFDSGEDYRVFYFEMNRKTCIWKILGMGEYHSGFLAK